MLGGFVVAGVSAWHTQVCAMSSTVPCCNVPSDELVYTAARMSVSYYWNVREALKLSCKVLLSPLR